MGKPNRVIKSNYFLPCPTGFKHSNLLLVFDCRGLGRVREAGKASISKQKVRTLLGTCHILLFQSTIFNPLEKMLAKRRAFGKELTKTMQLWGHNYDTDKAGENAAFVSEAAWDKNRNFMEN